MQTLLEIRRICGGYRDFNVIEDVSLCVNTGDILGIIGPNGSGKTTLLRLATRVLRPSSGSLCLYGEDIFGMKPKEFAKKVAFVGQDINTGFSFTALEVALLGRIPHLGRLQFEGKIDRRIAEESLELTDSLGLRNKCVDELSAGERQRVIIARALAQEPALLLLDEPTSHLDIGHQIQTLDLLKRLNRAKNLTIAMILHDLNLASAYCNRIALLEGGRIFKEGDPEDVLTYQNIESVYKTVVLVTKNQVTGKPNVMLVPGEAA